MKTAVGCAMFLVVFLATITAYLSIYFTASQPANHGLFKYKVYASMVIALLILEIILFVYWLLKKA
jgi:hypothetical protein